MVIGKLLVILLREDFKVMRMNEKGENGRW